MLTKAGPEDDFSLLLPSVGGQLSDPGNISDNADKISDDWKAFDRAIDSQSNVSQDCCTSEDATSGLPSHAC